MSALDTEKYSKQIRYPGRKLTKEETTEILNLQPSDINNTTLTKYFCATLKQPKPRFNTYDTLEIPVNYFKNKQVIEMRIGLFFYNRLCIPNEYLIKYGPVTEELTKGGLQNIESKFASMILENEIDVTEYNDYINKAEWLGMSCCKYMVPSMSYNFLTPIKEVMDKKEEMFTEYSQQIKEGNPNVVEKIENELISTAKEQLNKDNDPTYELFKSGVFKINTQYKKTSILGGGFKDLITGNLKLLKSNYVDGVTVPEYADFSQYTVIGAYARGVSTQLYGTLTKVISAGMQNAVPDEDPESDCGTKKYLEIEIKKELLSMYKYRYIVEGEKLVLLTPDNINTYVGKTVKMRSPMFCKNDKICAKCCGQLFHRMGIKNPQLMCISLSGALLNKSMQKFHDTSMHYNQIDYTKYNEEF